jgi:hypothetical protein
VVPPDRELDRVDLSEFIPDDLADRARRESPEFADGVAAADRPGEPQTGHRTQQASPEIGGADDRATPTVWEQMGGPMGMVDSGLPVVVFVIGNAIAGLGWGIGAALAAGVLIAGMRIARRRPVTQAIAGLFGVGIAAYIAYRTGSAKGYFLLGIWSYLLYGGALLLSMIVRWPLVGVIWEGINGRGAAWRSDKRLVRRYDWATFVWVVVFAARYLVQNYLYDNDLVGWLAAVRLLMGYPLFIAAIAISLVIVAGTEAAREHGGVLKERILGLRRGQRRDPPAGPARPDEEPA